jgi:hypothetical protein
MNINIVLVLFVFSTVLNAEPGFYDGVSSAQIQKRIDGLSEKQRSLQKKINECEKWTGSKIYGTNQNHPCSEKTWTGFQKVDIGKLREEVESVADELRLADVAFRKKSSQDGAKVTVDGLAFRLESQHLLMKTQDLKMLLNGNERQVDAVMKSIDDTFLGQYSNYVAQEAVKKALGGEKNICSAVARCKDSRDSKALMDAIKGDVMSFKKWRNEQTTRAHMERVGGEYSGEGASR